MNSSIIYITKFIEEYKLNNDIIDIENLKKELYKKSLMSKHYEEDNLLLVYHKFELPTNTSIEKECRSLAIDTKTLKIISYTCENPICNKEAQHILINNSSCYKEIYKCYEGTLLSLFNHNNKWYLSTRRCLDANESTLNNKSHYDMFMDVLNKENLTFDEFTNKFNVNYGYYFVLLHYENKNIINYEKIFGEKYSKLCLIFTRDKETQEELEDNNFIETENIFKSQKTDMDYFTEENKTLNLDLNCEGIIIKLKNDEKEYLLKLQTISYQFLKATTINSNIYKDYLYLYQMDFLKNYLENYASNKYSNKIVNSKNTSEEFDTIGVIDAVFKVLTSELFELYKLFWDFKTKEQKNIELYKLLPKEYKYILYQLRGIFFKIKASNIKSKADNNNEFNTFGIKNIYQYLKSMNSIYLIALLKQRKLMSNWLNINNDVNLQLFRSITIKCDKVHLKLTAIYLNKLFPEINSTEIPIIENIENI
jgi:hypothetical protein